MERLDTEYRYAISQPMRSVLRDGTTWLGRKVHPVRLLIEIACAVYAFWQVGILFSVFFARLTYPMDLEWMEGGTLYESYRLLHGLPLYERPVITWAPYPYPPAHPALVALVGCLHLDFWTGRLVSIFFFTVLCVALFREVYKHLQRSAFGIALGALAVATVVCAYPVIGQWYDLVRVDVMMLGLWVAGTARVLSSNAGRRHIWWTAVLFSLAVFTKQTAAVLVGWSCLFLIIHRPRVGLKLAAYTASLCLIALLLVQWTTSGAFWYLTISNLGQHEIKSELVAEGFVTVFKYAPFAVLTPFVLLLLALKDSLSPRSILWVGSLLIAIPTSIIPYAKVGGYLNALLPLIVLVGPATIFVISDIVRHTGTIAAIARWASLAGLAYFISQRPLLPESYTPSSKKWRAARELNAIVASLKGGVVCPYLGFLPAHNGHSNPHWQSMVVWDSVWRGEPMNEIAALEHSGAKWVLLHSNDGGSFASHVRHTSRFDRRIPDSARVRMVTGAAVEIDELWERELR